MNEEGASQNEETRQDSEVGKEYSPPATQADLDRIIEDRLSRERRKYSDYDDMKSKLSEYETWKQSQLTEQEKAVQAAREEGKTEATTVFERKLVAAEVKAQAVALGFHDPSDVIAYFGDELPIKDGGPDTDAIKTKLGEIAGQKPYLVKVSQTPGPARRPKLPEGRKQEDTTHNGKGRAAAALRQLGAQRHR
jgi:hypothetical protein